MVAVISELCYALYLLDEILHKNGEESDKNHIYGYAKDLYSRIEFMIEHPETIYEVNEQEHEKMVKIAEKYYEWEI